MTPLSYNPTAASYPPNLSDSLSEDEELLSLHFQGTEASGDTLIVNDAVDQAGTNFGVDWSLYKEDQVLVIRYKQRAPRKRIPEIFYDSIYTTTKEEELKKCPPSPTGAHIYKEMIIREELVPKTSKFASKIKPGKLDWLPAALQGQQTAGENAYDRPEAKHPFGPSTGTAPLDQSTTPIPKSTPATKDPLQPERKLWERIAETIVPLAKKIIAWIKAAFGKIRLMLEMNN